MRIVRTARAMQRQAQLWRRKGICIALVPTMGYLHAGHASLIRCAHRAVGPEGRVVVSIYVNPTQFAPAEDLSRYPRDLKRDTRLCREAQADLIFFPSDEEMYPGRSTGAFSTYVIEEELSSVMEGASRPTHFRGVTTVVAKLFNIALPDVAVFGAKDFQQAAILRRMTRDLNFPVRFLVAPTVREPDGLALSSRNKYLNPEERAQGTVLWKVIQAARREVRQSRVVKAPVLRRKLVRLIGQHPAARLDYIEFFDPRTLRSRKSITRGTHLALAVFMGKTRLIDNSVL